MSEKQVIYLRIEAAIPFDETTGENVEDLMVHIEEDLNRKVDRAIDEHGAHLVEVSAEEDLMQHIRDCAVEVERRTGTNPLRATA